MGDKAPYKNPENSVEERVKDLLGRMTLKEKLAQMSCTMGVFGAFQNMEEALKDGIGQISVLQGSFTKEMNADVIQTVQDFLINNTRLGIPAMFHGETLNGSETAQATCYQIPMGLGATFDPEAIGKMADNIRQEVDALGMKLSFGPVMDVARDPRWGRVGETYGESATLTSAMSVAYVKGLQGDDLRHGSAAVAKHFLGYAMGEGGMNISAAHMGPREVRELFAKPFEAAIQMADLQGVMNSYHVIDGEPIIGNPAVLKKLLRDELGFKGLTVSDYDSITKLKDVYHVAGDNGEAGALALKAGMDSETPFQVCYGEGLEQEIEAGNVPLELVDEAVSRILSMKFRLGLFENPYSDRERMDQVFQKQEFVEDAKRIACESIVLLKNDNGLLPIDAQKYQSVAVIGPNGDDLRNLFGGYTVPACYEMLYGMMTQQSGGVEGVKVSEENGDTNASFASGLPPVEPMIQNDYPGIKTVYAAIAEALPQCKIKKVKGCAVLGNDCSGFEEAVAVAKESDLVILVLGGKNGSSAGCSMGENVDSSSVGLPGMQEELAKAVAGTGKPIILVHMDGRPLSSVWASEHIPAILEAWHPGQCGADAIADVLTGKYNPGGKLPMTAVRDSGQIPVYVDQLKGSGMTSRGMTNSTITTGYVDQSGYPLYPFGFGLSYTGFSIGDMVIEEASVRPDGVITVSCTVSNTGNRPGDEVVQLYFSDVQASVVRPDKDLAGFARVSLEPCETKEVTFHMQASQCAFLDSDMRWKVEKGEIKLMIGTSSDNLPLEGSVTIAEDLYMENSRRGYYAEAAIKNVMALNSSKISF